MTLQVEASNSFYMQRHSRDVLNQAIISLVPRPHPHEEERVTSEFLVVLSQHVRKTGNPIRLLALLQSCDMKEN